MARLDPSIGRGLAFFAGVGIAAIPSVGPFIALLTIFTGRLTIQRADVWWWAAAFLLSAPFIATGHAVAGLATAGQVVAVWLIYRSAIAFRANVRSDTFSTDIGAGLIIGLAITLGLGLSQIGGVNFGMARTALDALVWNVHPAIFGHAILVLSALLALVVPSPRLRVLALAIGAIGVTVSGSREAVWAWLLIAVALQFVGRRSTRGTRVAEWALICGMTLLVSGVAPWLGLGRTGFLTDFVPPQASANLFRGTEIAKGDWWYPLGVEFSGQRAVIGDQERTTLSVTKVSEDSWARLQQAVTLEPGETYTLSAAVRASPASRPGFDGWGRASGDDPPVNLGTFLVEGTHRTNASGALTVVSSSAEPQADHWVRLAVTFRYTGERPLVWYVGVVPDRSLLTGITTTFTELQLLPSYVLLPYRPGLASRGVTDLTTSRFPIWRDALDAIGARPLFGWGPDGFPTAVRSLHPDDASLRPVAAHAHNALLAVWVDRGVVGALGLVLLFALLSLRVIQHRDKGAAAVLLGVLILNTFDTTLLSGAVIYPLAAVLGWRAVGRREAAQAETGFASAVAVRVSLALSDALAGVLALSLGILVAARFEPGLSLGTGWRLPLLYATLTWPVIAMTVGLYPGYGLPSYKKLGLSVRASASAAVAVGFLALLLPDVFGLPAQVFLVAVPAAAFFAPTTRAATQLLLRRLRLWGRPIVIVGADPSAVQVTRHLLSHPDMGLHPVAIFGDDDLGTTTELPVTGGVASAWDFIERNGIRHVIVSAGAPKDLAFDQVLVRPGARVKYVQYIPDLRNLPTNPVVATPLGTTLGLEVRIELASGLNRAVKRATDFLGALVLLLLLGVPLLLIALLVRFDSRGPALYVSPRIGRYGREFGCIKFRTMHLDADERLEALLDERPDLRAEYERYHKLEDDPRVTRIGRLLRKVSIDEFPQLLNVLAGQMSLVGPRPYMVRERELMGSEQEIILLARPGMTGYWQTEARNDVGFAERQSMEAHYVRNWSIWWDLDILLHTPAAMLGRTGK